MAYKQFKIMEEKLKVNLYVRGDILSASYVSCHQDAKIIEQVPESEVDLSNAIVVDGPVQVESLMARPDATVAASGGIYLHCRTSARGKKRAMSDPKDCKHYYINTGGGWACWCIEHNQPCYGTCPDFIPKGKKN